MRKTVSKIPHCFRLVEQLQSWDFRVCAVFVLDAGYMVDAARFLSGSLTALATMVQLEVLNHLPNPLDLLTVTDSIHSGGQGNLLISLSLTCFSRQMEADRESLE